MVLVSLRSIEWYDVKIYGYLGSQGPKCLSSWEIGTERARVRSWVTAGLLQFQEAVTSVAASTPTLSVHTSCL